MSFVRATSIDDAIQHCLDVVEEKKNKADKYNRWDEWESVYADDCIQCATDHQQLAEWLMELKELREFNDKIYDILAKQFGSPCNLNYAVDEYMRRNGGCDDCGIEIPDKECWSRYIQTKLIGDKK